ncbi:hypothetical protein LTR99_006152 [Exophiala xenobiotica]|nr:hypothetical protein LTR92_010320 [Exophiala xenobiotica]KAK5533091.1 hypothetical protein LTR23_009388 [Chaetothyriales sp. CCFEE 6169]KAK5217150.1 hypothetical protein LTR72_009716 [Exophiala xenobiotica]KAK5244582.1 hypothetical protein LTS06_009880 [Exophiala xenobiotica]KAK5265053.1 hypothetical protein LTR96_009420 [Exophiala xenobiotica]
MSLPIVYPAVRGPGRLLEICSFRKSEIPESKFQEIFRGLMQKISTFDVARQNSYGTKEEDKRQAVLVADWTSAEDKDVFAATEQFESVKPIFGQIINTKDANWACHHLILPGAVAKTGQSTLYSVSQLIVPVAAQTEFAKALDIFIQTVDKGSYDFIVAGASREDDEVIVVLMGFPSAGVAEKTGSQLSEATKAFVKSATTYDVKLEKQY